MIDFQAVNAGHQVILELNIFTERKNAAAPSFRHGRIENLRLLSFDRRWRPPCPLLRRRHLFPGWTSVRYLRNLLWEYHQIYNLGAVWDEGIFSGVTGVVHPVR